MDWNLAIELSECRPWFGGAITLTFPGPAASLDQLGLLANTSALPVVRKDLLRAVCSEIEECAAPIPCKLECTDGTCGDFVLLNVVRSIAALDHSESKIVM